MSTPLVLFPSRAPIGTVSGAQVYASPEFQRALALLLERVGGATSPSMGDIVAELATPPADTAIALGATVAALQDRDTGAAAPAALVLALSATVADLQGQAGVLLAQAAQLGELAKQLADQAQLSLSVPVPTDWEHPGKIGAAKANSGQFTTLATTAKTQLNPTGADVEIKPTGAGKAVISPATAGTMDNVAVGGTTPAAGAFTTASTTGNLTIGTATVAAGLAPVSYCAGYPGSAAPQFRHLLNHPGAGLLGWGSDGVASMIFGRASASTGAIGATWATLGSGGLAVAAGFGCNGKTAQTSYALGAAATDAASTQTLANNIRAALLANGIGS